MCVFATFCGVPCDPNAFLSTCSSLAHTAVGPRLTVVPALPIPVLVPLGRGLSRRPLTGCSQYTYTLAESSSLAWPGVL
jgi:hypothetical protein